MKWPWISRAAFDVMLDEHLQAERAAANRERGLNDRQDELLRRIDRLTERILDMKQSGYYTSPEVASPQMVAMPSPISPTVEQAMLKMVPRKSPAYAAMVDWATAMKESGAKDEDLVALIEKGEDPESYI